MKMLTAYITLLLGKFAAQGQGYVAFNNTLNAPFGGVMFASPASQAGFTAQLLVGSSPETLMIIASTSTWVDSSHFDGGVVALPNGNPGGSAKLFVVRVFDGGSYESAATQRGQTSPSSFVPKATPDIAPSPGNSSGILSFLGPLRLTLVPEPSTLALGVIASVVFLTRKWRR